MNLLDSHLHIAITGFGGKGNPEPGHAVADAIIQGVLEKTGDSKNRAGDIEITALLYEGWESAAWGSDSVSRLYQIPPLMEGAESALERILELHQQHPIDVLIPTLDLEIPLYATLAARLQKEGIATLLPEISSLEKVTKAQLPYFCHQYRIQAPRTVVVDHPNKVSFHANQLGFPLFVKGAIVGAKRVESAEQAYQEANALYQRWNREILLQMPVIGEEYVVAMVAGTDGSSLGMVMMRKLGINRRGKGVVGAVVDSPELKKKALRILEKLQWRGALELEFIHTKSGRWMLVEVNNRFPSWILLSQFSGLNLPLLLVQEALQQEEKKSTQIFNFEYQESPNFGTAFVRSVEEISLSLEDWRSFQRYRQFEKPTKNLAKELTEKKKKISEKLETENVPVVAITGISAFDEVMPGLGIARALQGKARLHVLAYGVYDTGAYHLDLFEKVHLLPERLEEKALLELCKQLREKHHVDILIPALDVEIPKFQKLATKIDKLGIRLLLPSENALEKCSKANLSQLSILVNNHEMTSVNQFSLLETETVNSEQDLRQVVKKCGFPLALKGQKNGCWFLGDEKEISTCWAEIRQQERGEVLVQEWVAGEMFAIAGVCDKQHQAHSLVSIKKQQSGEYGETWAAFSVALPDLEQVVADIMQAVQWSGPFEAEFIRDRETEQFVLIEINPRFPAWIGFCADLPVNPVRKLVEMMSQATSQKIRKQEIAQKTIPTRLFLRFCTEYPVDSVARFAMGIGR